MMRTTIPAEEILHKAHSVGQYYGFRPLADLTAKARGAARAKGYPETLAGITLDPSAESVASFLKQCQNIEAVPSSRQPLFLWHTNIAAGRAPQKKAVVQFHTIGADRALADAAIIRAALALVRDLYHEEPVLRINSMGDKETRARYARELGNFFKKRAGTLSEECLSRAKSDAFDAAEYIIANECADELPAPTEHLSDASRKRFEDLLEYLEMTETPYELARTLLSRGNAWNDLCFEILAGEKRVAWGSRYNELARHFFKTPSPLTATGVVLTFASGGTAVVKKAPSPRIRFSFVHIGDEAKRLSIKLAEDLRKARVPLVQHIGVESLTEQMLLAEHASTPYLLIMGRKEALESSAILRHRENQTETTIPLASLIERLKATA